MHLTFPCPDVYIYANYIAKTSSLSWTLYWRDKVIVSHPPTVSSVTLSVRCGIPAGAAGDIFEIDRRPVRSSL